jgi:tetratricopeptide (TPR) repeat protein
MAKADLLERQGQHDAAAKTRRRALSNDPSSAIGGLARAAELVQAGDVQGARAALVHLLEQPFLHDRIHLELGLIEMRLGNDEKAREHFAHALALTSDRTAIEARIAALGR